MNRYFVPLFCLFSLTVFAQGPESESPEIELSTAEHEQQSIDTLASGIISPREHLSLKDSILSLFQHHHESILIDSLWRQELYASSLFDELYEEITSFDAEEEIIYEELSTEVLKERLAL